MVCPKGFLKKSCEEILNGCEMIGETCPEGYHCLCDPCLLVRSMPHPPARRRQEGGGSMTICAALERALLRRPGS